MRCSCRAKGLKATHVPCRGGAQAITDLLRGEVHFMFYHYLPLLPHIAEGKLRALAITSAKRIDALPDVPVMKEAGMNDFEVSAWFGVWAPAKTSPEIVGKLNTIDLRHHQFARGEEETDRPRASIR